MDHQRRIEQDRAPGRIGRELRGHAVARPGIESEVLPDQLVVEPAHRVHLDRHGQPPGGGDRGQQGDPAAGIAQAQGVLLRHRIEEALDPVDIGLRRRLLRLGDHDVERRDPAQHRRAAAGVEHVLAGP